MSVRAWWRWLVEPSIQTHEPVTREVLAGKLRELERTDEGQLVAAVLAYGRRQALEHGA